MLDNILLAIPWEITPSLILSVTALIGAFVTLYKLFKDYNKTKLEGIKQTAFNKDKVEKIDIFSQDVKKDLEEVKKILNNVKNKQEVDYDYIMRLIDNVEKDLTYYRDIIISQFRNNGKI